MRRVFATAALVMGACGEAPTAPEPTAPIEAAPIAWESRLSEMLPYIDACLAASPETRTISYASLLNDREAVVRLGGASGEFVCTVPTAEPTAANAAIISDDEEMTFEGEGSALFVRGPGPNPGGECYEAPEVRNADGEVIGWMLDPEGC